MFTNLASYPGRVGGEKRPGIYGIHFVHRLWGQKAHDYHVTEYADARIRAPNWTYAGTGSVQATHANM